MKKVILILLSLIVGLFVGSELIFSFLLTPSVTSTPEASVFEVSKGASLTRVANQLESQGLVTNAHLFKVYALMRSSDRSIKMGEYQLTKGQSPTEILAILSSGKSLQYSVTLPEGSNIFEVADALGKTGHFERAKVLASCRDPEFIQQLLGVSLPSLEGYLFPETYKYTKYTTHRELLRAMTSRFLENFEKIQAQYPTELSRHEIVTLASVIEKETGAPQERRLISSVFHNRIKKGMRLQSDPTIIYGMWVATGKEPFNITKKDILRPTPFNTYTVPKLPFGPIANPGREALEATLSPAESEFLFFVSRNDGTHVFTSTYADHSKAVREFQMDSRARAGKSWRDLNKKSR